MPQTPVDECYHINRLQSISNDYSDCCAVQSPSKFVILLIDMCVGDMLDSINELRLVKNYAVADKWRDWLISNGWRVKLGSSPSAYHFTYGVSK